MAAPVFSGSTDYGIVSRGDNKVKDFTPISNVIEASHVRVVTKH